MLFEMTMLTHASSPSGGCRFLWLLTPSIICLPSSFSTCTNYSALPCCLVLILSRSLAYCTVTKQSNLVWWEDARSPRHIYIAGERITPELAFCAHMQIFVSAFPFFKKNLGEMLQALLRSAHRQVTLRARGSIESVLVPGRPVGKTWHEIQQPPRLRRRSKEIKVVSTTTGPSAPALTYFALELITLIKATSARLFVVSPGRWLDWWFNGCYHKKKTFLPVVNFVQCARWIAVGGVGGEFFSMHILLLMSGASRRPWVVGPRNMFSLCVYYSETINNMTKDHHHRFGSNFLPRSVIR